MSLPGGHLKSLGGGWFGLLLGACLAGELGVAGAPEGWDAWMFFSSEKSCFITSKKLVNGLPRYTDGKKTRERENKQRMSNGVTARRGGDGGMRRGLELEKRRLLSQAKGRGRGLGVWDRWRLRSKGISSTKLSQCDTLTQVTRNNGPTTTHQAKILQISLKLT